MKDKKQTIRQQIIVFEIVAVITSIINYAIINTDLKFAQLISVDFLNSLMSYKYMFYLIISLILGVIVGYFMGLSVYHKQIKY